MFDYSNDTGGIDNSGNLGNIKGGHHFNLGNGREEIAKVASSFKGATHRYPYPLNLPFLTGQGAGAHDPLSYLQADVSQYKDPTKRQAQNLDRAPKAVVSYPVLLLVAGVVVALAVLTITLNVKVSGSVTR